MSLNSNHVSCLCELSIEDFTNAIMWRDTYVPYFQWHFSNNHQEVTRFSWVVEYSRVLGNTQEHLGILGNSRKYSEIVGNTRDQIGISPRFVGLVMISAFLWLFGRRFSPRRVVDYLVVC